MFSGSGSDHKSCGKLSPSLGLARAISRVTLGMLLSLCFCGVAFSQDNGDDNGDGKAKTAPQFPTTYLDLRTTYNTLPANSLSIGFSGPSVLASHLTLLSHPNSFSSPSSQSIGVDVPLTVDLNDRISVYGGFTASASQNIMTPWTSLAVSSWNVGFQADVYQQKGGNIPTITVQSTLTRSVPDSPLATTSLNTLVEADYALNEDETRGLLAGIQHTRVAVDTPLATINPNTIGYVGAYYQWDNNWKLTGRAGIQSFEGAQIPNLTAFQPFTQPIVRIDLDRMDDNDNRLFGISAQIAWAPKPAYQLILRTPLYAVRN